MTEAYNSLKINGKSVKSMPFEQFAVLIESSSTLQTVKALLDRLESRLKVAKVVAATSYPFSFDNIDHLLKRVKLLKGGLLQVLQGAETQAKQLLGKYLKVLLNHPDIQLEWSFVLI